MSIQRTVTGGGKRRKEETEADFRQFPADETRTPEIDYAIARGIRRGQRKPCDLLGSDKRFPLTGPNLIGVGNPPKGGIYSKRLKHRQDGGTETLAVVGVRIKKHEVKNSSKTNLPWAAKPGFQLLSS